MEEINLMCVFEGQDRAVIIADIKNIIPHIQDSDLVELAGQVLGNILYCTMLLPYQDEAFSKYRMEGVQEF